METCRDLELVGEDAMRVLENARADLETAHKAAEESGVPPTAPEALIALKAADVLAVAFDRHLQQAEEEKAERDAFLDHIREGQEEGKDADSPATIARRSAVEVDLDVRFPRLVFFVRARCTPRPADLHAAMACTARRRRVDALDARRRCRRRRRRRRASEK